MLMLIELIDYDYLFLKCMQLDHSVDPLMKTGCIGIISATTVPV